MDENKKKYFVWMLFNILLPLTPVFIKLVIIVFGNHDIFSIDVLDSAELLYYNFVICTIQIFEIMQKTEMTLVDLGIIVAFFLVIIIDIILLVIIYGRLQEGVGIGISAIVMSVLIPVVASVRKHKEVTNE